MIELKVVEIEKSLIADLLTAEAGKTRSAPDVGAAPPQFAGSDQSPLAPSPDHVKVEGVSRDSSRSRYEMTNRLFFLDIIEFGRTTHISLRLIIDSYLR